MFKRAASEESIFFTPRQFAQEQISKKGSPRGDLLIASCRSGDPIAQKIVQRYKDLLGEAGEMGDLQYLAHLVRQFSDSETCARLEQDVSGRDVFLVQSLLDPNSAGSIDQNYMAFFITVRTFREWGANHITGVLPYLAYARQDKPTRTTREPTTAKLMADLSVSAGIDRLVTWNPHCNPIQAFYGHIPVDALEPVDLFAEILKGFENRPDVILVAPDSGVSKIVTRLGRRLHLNCAIATKDRPRPEEAEILEVMGDFSGKRAAIIVDDMISSGGTVDALVKKLAVEKGMGEFYLAVSHNLCMPAAYERLLDLHQHFGLKEVFVTNSIPQTGGFCSLEFLSVICLSEILARVINRIHYNRSISDLVLRAG
jgi:ribose-phosphate pyrophosphokinase